MTYNIFHFQPLMNYNMFQKVIVGTTCAVAELKHVKAAVSAGGMHILGCIANNLIH